MSLITDALQKAQRQPTPAWEPLPPPRTPKSEPLPPRPADDPESRGGPPSQHPWWPAAIALWIIGLSVLLLRPPEGGAKNPVARHRAAPAPIAPAPAPAASKAPELEVPKPIAAFLPPLPAAPPPLMSLTPLAWKVDGVIVGMGKPTAIINGKVVEEGGEVHGAKVVSVTQHRVQLLHHGELIDVSVEEP